MTQGEIYEENKEIYNKEAIEFISERLQKKGDMCHRPFELMTYFSRMIIEKISEDSFLCFTGYVKNTEYSDYREIKNYKGEKINNKIIDKNKLIHFFGFEISTNPRSKSNILINQTK